MPWAREPFRSPRPFLSLRNGRVFSASRRDPLRDSRPPDEQDRSSIGTRALSGQDYVLPFERPRSNGRIGFLLDLVYSFLELYSSIECRSGKRKDLWKSRMRWSGLKTAWAGPKRENVYGQAVLGRRMNAQWGEVRS